MQVRFRRVSECRWQRHFRGRGKVCEKELKRFDNSWKYNYGNSAKTFRQPPAHIFQSAKRCRSRPSHVSNWSSFRLFRAHDFVHVFFCSFWVILSSFCTRKHIIQFFHDFSQTFPIPKTSFPSKFKNSAKPNLCSVPFPAYEGFIAEKGKAFSSLYRRTLAATATRLALSSRIHNVGIDGVLCMPTWFGAERIWIYKCNNFLKIRYQSGISTHRVRFLGSLTANWISKQSSWFV